MVLIIVVSGFCALSIYLSHQGIYWTSYTFLFFWPVWLIGAWLAEKYESLKLQNLSTKFLIICLSAILSLGIISHLQNWLTWLQYIIWTIFYTILFIFSLTKNDFLNFPGMKKLMSVLGWLGKISFSLYLIHFPLFKLFGLIHRSYFIDKPANFMISLAYLLPVCFLAWIFYRLIEFPIHQWSKRFLK